MIEEANVEADAGGSKPLIERPATSMIRRKASPRYGAHGRKTAVIAVRYLGSKPWPCGRLSVGTRHARW